MWQNQKGSKDYGYWKIESKKIRALFWSVFILSMIYIFYPRSIAKMLPNIDEIVNNTVEVSVVYEGSIENITVTRNESIKKVLDEIRPYKGRVTLRKGMNNTGEKTFHLTLPKKDSISTINIIGKRYIQIVDNGKDKMFKLYGKEFNSEELSNILSQSAVKTE